MAKQDADTRYGEFVATGSGRSFAAFFDLVAPELLRVASAVSRPGMDPRDLVQQTMLVALEKSASFDSQRPVLPWLCGILANIAHTERRILRRRPGPDALASDARVLDPAVEVELDEAQQHAVRALTCVPQPHRGALELLLVHGLTPAEIARVLNRKRATVRSQIARGLDSLRKRLPGSMAPGIALVHLKSNSLGNVRRELLERLPGPTGVASALAITVAYTMKKHLIAFAGLALLSTIVVMATMAPPSPSVPPESSVGRGDTAQASLSARDESVASPDVDSARPTRNVASPNPTSAATTGRLRVVVRHAATAEPAADVGVFLAPMPSDNHGARMPTYQPLCSARTDSAGHVLVEELAPGSWEVMLDRGASSRALVVAGEVTTAAIELKAGLRVEGRVIDANNEPISGARIERWSPHRRGFALGMTAADGKFTITDLLPGSYIIARADGFQTSGRVALEGLAGAVRRVTVRMQFGAKLRGKVWTPNGAPANGVAIGVAPDAVGNTGQTDEGHPIYGAGPDVTVTDEQGAFAFSSLPAGLLNVLVAPRNDRWGRYRTAVELTAERPENLIVYLPLPATIAGTVRGVDGRQRAGVRITCAPKEFVPGFGFGPFTHAVTHTTPDGRFQLAGLGSGPRKTYAHESKGVRPVESEIELQAGNEHEWNPVIGTELLSIHVVAPNQSPLSGWMVRVGLEGHVNGERAITDDAGVAQSRSPGQRTTHVSVYHPSQARCSVPFAAVTRVLPAGVRNIEVIVPAEALEMAAVTLPIVDTANQPVADCTYALIRSGFGFARDGVVGRDGVVRLLALPPGEYRLLLKPSTSIHARTQTQTFTVRCGQQLKLPPTKLAVGRRISVRASWPGGAANEDIAIELTHTANGRMATQVSGSPDASGSWQSPLLAPGEWMLSLHGPGMRRTVQHVSLAERDLQLAIHAEEAPTVAFSLRVAHEQAARWFRGRMQIVDRAGAIAVDVSLAGELSPSQPINTSVGLVPGNYELRAMDSNGHTWHQSIVVPPSSANAIRQTITIEVDT